ncbi:MAG: peptide chain release factor N(5)-glutamine methyltransferase [Prevotella sp.]|nr:peptide chain release factor N(5)-glutamine methyltransferase [Prevotella sp.]
MTYQEACREVQRSYDAAEAKAIVRLVLEERFSLSWADIVCDGTASLDADQQAGLQTIIHRLAGGEPVQYVLGEAFFAGRRFVVRHGVLIPRPETEELCRWMVADLSEKRSLSVLDMGTGSGCIACTLALELPESRVSAWDIAPTPLAVAGENARRLRAGVVVEQQDILNPPRDERRWDVIVSNPPYVCESEQMSMESHVLGHEPHEALFVPDTDALRFYRAIADYGRQALRQEGSLWLEINPLFAGQLCDMLGQKGYAGITERDDQFGRKRFIKATQP